MALRLKDTKGKTAKAAPKLKKSTAKSTSSSEAKKRPWKNGIEIDQNATHSPSSEQQRLKQSLKKEAIKTKTTIIPRPEPKFGLTAALEWFDRIKTEPKLEIPVPNWLIRRSR